MKQLTKHRMMKTAALVILGVAVDPPADLRGLSQAPGV